MTGQWDNSQIAQRPFTRFNPSIKQKIANVYLPWFMLFAILTMMIGIAIIVLASILRHLNDDLHNELFHLWIGIPLFVFGLVSMVPFITKGKRMAVFVLVFSIILAVVCATGAVISGLRYWMDFWQQAKRDLNNNKCTLVNDKCSCKSIQNTMPASVDNCDDLKTMADLLISLTALAAGGFISCVSTAFLSFMSVCCGPWMYIEWYDENNDPDFSGGKVRRSDNTNVQINHAYGRSD